VRTAFLWVAAGALIIGAWGWWLLHQREPDAAGGAAYNQREQITLRFTYWGSPEEKRAIESALGKFMQTYPRIKVEGIQLPNLDYNTKLKAMVALNEEPDIAYMTSYQGEQFDRQDRFHNLYAFLEKDPDIRKEDFLDYLWYERNPNYAWGMSTAGEAFGLYYRRDLLEQAGLEAPPARSEEAWDWERFVHAAKTLTLDANGRNAHHPLFDPDAIVRYGVMFETWSEPINNFIFSNGGDWVDADGKFNLNSPETAEAIQLVADLMNVHHVAPSPYESRSMPSPSVALQSGLAAMIIDGQWINLDLAKAGVDFDIGVLPKLKRSVTVAQSGATVIFKSSEHPEEAWLLFKWLADPHEALELYADGLWMPVLKDWYTEPGLIAKWVDANPEAHPPGFRDAMMRQLIENGVPGVGYYVKNQAAVFPSVTEGLMPVWLGVKTSDEALAELEERLKPIWGQIP